MSVPADPQPPDAVRDAMVEIFQRPEFQRKSGPLQQLLERFGTWLEKLFDGAGGSAGSAAWGGPIGNVILWVVLTLLLAGLVWMVVTLIRRRRPRVRADAPTLEIGIDEHRSASDWASSAAGFEQSHDWKEAMRCRYRELVARLTDAGIVADLAGRTTGEIRSDVTESLPAVASEFTRATQLFELPWYADEPTGMVENEEFRRLATTVLGAAMSATSGTSGMSAVRPEDASDDRHLVGSR